ncbi:hypothetical protein [Desulfotruncus alcoholivorax]|uniref:hypothetical protein n=1 Tax=Desulfotruncus alcoholivorax TaxID=265477 RepID=UPI00040B3F20|nr:hypothetical protein [Desulfotruncus alcoholivorax]
MPLLITTDTGQVKVGSVILPGVFESIEITGAVKLDQVEIQGKKDKVTQAVGFDNATVRLTVNLLPETEGGDCTEQIAQFQKIFRSSPDQEKPGVYQLINKHAAARNISEVIFTNFRSYEDNKSDKIIVICEFSEHIPIKVPVATKSSAAASPPPAKPKAPATKSSAAASPTAAKPKAPAKRMSVADFRMLENKPIKPMSVADFRMLENKTSKTPAKDERKPGLGSRILSWLRGANNV